ncbi:MAG: aminoacyl-histidine dipeptidase [Tidjanibacter sp.]|nr:aminoacyl-histidine dipeptidase [Tidjanibacter sp.]
MDKNLAKLAPQAVWKNFQGLTQCPRPSHNEEAARNYIIEFVKGLGLEYEVDEATNILVRKPATAGMENRKTIVLQAHVDMVPQKNSDKVFNFDTDPIEAYIDGEWITANGTTLGADNGIGIAAMMAILEDKNLKHGPIEALFTATEETGMDGAFGLKAGWLKGEILLNLDSETEGELYVGCAGGMDFNATMRYGTGRIFKSDFSGYRLEIKGLKGGHSGMEIILQRANSNKLMARFLKTFMDKFGILLCDIDGGGLRNAIPREAFATVAVLKQYEKKFLAAVKRYEKLYQAEFKGIEDSISFKAVPVKCPSKCIDIFDTQDLIDAVLGLPNGIAKMSTAMPGLVQTSTNLARVVSEKGKFHILCLLRSSVRSEKEALAQQMKTICEMAGASVKLSGAYDGWNPNPESPILHTMKEGYKALYGKEPKVMAIHAGLECGIIGGVYPKMDMISCGPTICYPHSPDEKVNIASVEKFYNYLCYTLEHAPEK